MLELEEVRALAKQFLPFLFGNLEQEMPVYGVQSHKHLVIVP